MRWLTSTGDSGERLDRYLAGHFGQARNQIARWIRDGRVLVGGRPAKPSLRLDGEEWIECEPPARDAGERMEPEDGPLELLYEDCDCLVVNKPAGLVVHPGAGREGGTLAHRILHRYPETGAVGGPGRPGIVHRLDRDTTGALLVARTPEAYAKLSSDFAERRIDKSYVAIAYGPFGGRDAGTIDAPVGRHPHRRREMTVSPAGRPAITHYRIREEARGLALVEIGLETGRTHQIRVHLKHAGHPIVGDPVYGEARWKGLAREDRARLRDFGRPALHAWRLVFAQPRSGERLGVEAPIAADLERLWSEHSGASAAERLQSGD